MLFYVNDPLPSALYKLPIVLATSLPSKFGTNHLISATYAWHPFCSIKNCIGGSAKMTKLITPKEAINLSLRERKKIDWRQWYVSSKEQGNIEWYKKGVLYTCACCGFPTLLGRGLYHKTNSGPSVAFQRCFICEWVDDGTDTNNINHCEDVTYKPFPEPDPANPHLSLKKARKNFSNHINCKGDVERYGEEDIVFLIYWMRKNLLKYRFCGQIDLAKTIDSKRAAEIWKLSDSSSFLVNARR